VECGRSTPSFSHAAARHLSSIHHPPTPANAGKAFAPAGPIQFGEIIAPNTKSHWKVHKLRKEGREGQESHVSAGNQQSSKPTARPIDRGKHT
jgi:hypothetical protein